MTLGSAPLSSSAFYTPSLNAFNTASKALSDSTLKLSSGNRIIRAGDDVAGLSIATRMQSQLITIKQATSNAAQGDSLLQVAQSGLQQIIDILDSMDALATQSNSSTLTDTDRTYLQAQFAAYVDEIDRIAGTTSFNKIKLLNGNLSGEAEPTYTTTNATKASATVLFTDIDAAETVVINGVSFVADTDFAVGVDTAATVENLKNALNSSTNSAINKATYTRAGDSLIITADTGGTGGNSFIINKASSTSDLSVAVGNATMTADIFTLAGGADDGLGYGSTFATGTIGDAVVNTQSQTKGSVTLTLSGNASNSETLLIDNGNGGNVTFTFATSASTSTDIQIGSTVEETLQNAAKTISQYSGTSNFVTSQLDITVNGNSLVLTNKAAGNPGDFSGAVPDISETLASGTLSASTITGGTNTGINVNGVNNKDFIGTVTGFEATYVGSDSVTASITVGDHTYTAAITDTTPTSGNVTVRFTSEDGGYFDLQLANNQGFTVSDQTTADTYAGHLNAAIETLTFHQSRGISNFNSTGAFSGASAKLQGSDFSEVSIDSITATAPVATDATIDIVINGETYRANSGAGGKLGAGETLKFTNLTNANEALYLKNGITTQDFSTTDAAATFAANLREAFGLNEDGGGISFQVGTEITDKVNVVVRNSTTSRLFNGATPDISTQDNAADAQDVIDDARTSVLQNLAGVGAIQTRFQSAQDVNAKIIENVAGARSLLADTDIAEESTNYAIQSLKVNSGVAIIAQTRQLQAGLLTILQAGNR